jgi:hypothetical protein
LTLSALIGVYRRFIKGFDMTLALPPRSAKPRTRGITSMIDFGPDSFGWTGAPEGIRNVLEGFRRGIGRAVDYSIIAR